MALKDAYSGLQIGLHWATAALIGANYLISDGMEQAFDAKMEGASYGGLVPSFHVWAGSALLAIVLVRLVIRLMSGAPAKAGQTFATQVSGLVHWVLYALMIAVPALGVGAWFLGIDQAAGLHVLAMNTMMILILGHAGMAIFRHYVLRDGLLSKMTPLR